MSALPPCRSGQHSPELWFGTGADACEAKALCRVCPSAVRDECETEGWKHETGVWGGLTPRDRRKLDPDRFAAAPFRARAASADIDRAIRAARSAKLADARTAGHAARKSGACK